MADIYVTLNSDDKVVTRTLLHEAIPITGTIVSGTYGDDTLAVGTNIKNYTHGMFQSVYDYPYLSSSANHIFDLTVAYGAESSLSSSSNTQNAKKIQMYNQMAKVLMGTDVSGNIRRFDEDGDLSGGTKIDESMFFNFARLITKDEVKKGSFTLELGVSASYSDPFSAERVTLKDANATSRFYTSPAGEYAILYVSNSVGAPLNGPTGATEQAAGLLFYQAGVAVITGSVFGTLLSSSISGAAWSPESDGSGAEDGFDAMLTGSAISGNCDAIRHRVYDLSFNNTTEINSSIYFCRLKTNQFNYSTNPTYLSSSQIRVKTKKTDPPVSYVTGIGLYDSQNNLLAVAKLSEPLKKDPATELTLRVRLDY